MIISKSILDRKNLYFLKKYQFFLIRLEHNEKQQKQIFFCWTKKNP